MKRMALTTSLFALSFGLSQQIFAEENSQNLNNEESQEVQNNSNQDKKTYDSKKPNDLSTSTNSSSKVNSDSSISQKELFNNQLDQNLIVEVLYLLHLMLVIL